jgi:hypothetical protein
VSTRSKTTAQAPAGSEKNIKRGRISERRVINAIAAVVKKATEAQLTEIEADQEKYGPVWQRAVAERRFWERKIAADAPDPFLAERAAQIRMRGKRVVADVIEIGRLLLECKERCGHGNWLPWLEAEFGWSEDTAERFIRLNKLAGQIPQIAEYDIPVSGLYLLAAPSTPEAARDEVVERAGAGERLGHVDVKAIIEAHGESAVLRAAKSLRDEAREVRRTERLEELAA